MTRRYEECRLKVEGAGATVIFSIRGNLARLPQRRPAGGTLAQSLGGVCKVEHW